MWLWFPNDSQQRNDLSQRLQGTKEEEFEDESPRSQTVVAVRIGFYARLIRGGRIFAQDPELPRWNRKAVVDAADKVYSALGPGCLEGGCYGLPVVISLV